MKHRIAEDGKPAFDGIGAPGPNANPAFLYVLPDVKPSHRKYKAIQWLAARGFFPSPAPAQRTPSSILLSQPFRPDEPITEQEALSLLGLMSRRAQPGERPQTALASGSASPLTRTRGAKLLIDFMGWNAPGNGEHYADLQAGSADHTAAETLYAHWIDSRNWDDRWKLSLEGRLFFRPTEPLTRAQFAEMLTLAAIHFGPLWEDHPLDQF